jgi:hypothetical protein
MIREENSDLAHILIEYQDRRDAAVYVSGWKAE